VCVFVCECVRVSGCPFRLTHVRVERGAEENVVQTHCQRPFQADEIQPPRSERGECEGTKLGKSGKEWGGDIN